MIPKSGHRSSERSRADKKLASIPTSGQTPVAFSCTCINLDKSMRMHLYQCICIEFDKGDDHEALLRPRCLLALTPHRAARSRPPVRSRESELSSQNDA